MSSSEAVSPESHGSRSDALRSSKAGRKSAPFVVPGRTGACKGVKLKRKLLVALQKLLGRRDDRILVFMLMVKISSLGKGHSVER